MADRAWTVVLALVLLWTGAAVEGAEAKKGKEAEEPGKAEEQGPLSAGTFSGLAFRGVGPAMASGRIIDFAVHPEDRATYYAAAASGGVWKTVNAGTTWTSIFDGQASYSIGCITLDPTNPEVVWVGTGENNSQRSVSYGDGVYKSLDGGKTWKNVGLGESEHIGMIAIDPRDTDTVYVAAQGPLWGPGGDRGLYKTTDGGETWDKVLEISENTGVSEVLMDPRDPDVLYAAAYQRRRRVWTLIDGGPESAVYKSTDAGESWRKLEGGLPGGDVGRIGLAMAPSAPDVLYAIVEAAGDAGGFFRSTDRGESWEKRSGYVSGSPQYYQELFVDPQDPDRVYSMDTWMMVTDDGGSSFRQVGEAAKHVDNHALWIDPEDTDYLLSGCDGGVYESFDRGATWNFKANLPITQFYRVAVDQEAPFYNIYGGTQDNNTLGGPSRTVSSSGIVNSDWFVTIGGDGFQAAIDPEDPNTVYAQYQYGNLFRFDKASGEAIEIKPQEAPGEDPLRFNWDSPLIISPHSHTRLYFGAQRVFRSDDRGDTWEAVSPDLTRQIDRNTLEVMGRVWSVDAVAKNRSTSYYGTIVYLSESPLVEGLLYAGTDDGLIQVTEDGGGSWRRIESFPGVPDRAYVSRVMASRHDADTVYAAFDAHKDADFKPYVLRSTDRGRTWTSVAGDLPERGTVYALAEDPVEAELIFAGTEFGVFFTPDGGEKWVQLKGGVPPIAMRDLVIQEREGDLVLGTFGRGFYVLDDYSPLRGADIETLEQEAVLYPVRRAWMYEESAPLGLPGKGFLGDAYYTAPNPPFGAVITYYLKDGLKTLKEKRQEEEKKTEEEGGTVAYPSWDELRAEDREEAPAILLTVRDEEGNVIRRLEGPTGSGFHRVAWDLRFPAADPTDLAPADHGPFSFEPFGPKVVPGVYTVSLSKRVDGVETPLGESQEIETVPLGLATLPAADRAASLAFQRKTARLQRAVLGALAAAEEAGSRLAHIKAALDDTPAADPALAETARTLEDRLQDLQVELQGDRTIARRAEPTPHSIVERVQGVVYGQWTSSSAPTQTQRDAYRFAADAFAPVLDDLRQLIEEDLEGLEAQMEEAGAPWTPGRVPAWEPE